ncbi:MAG: hypothetical protein PHQ21_04260 [Firmicutes bacterium]|nr:hypothetical protein [Bacillota bacterium]
MAARRIATIIIPIMLIFMAGLVQAGSDSASSWRSKIESFYDYDTTQPLEESFALLHDNQWYLHYDVSYKSEGDIVYAHYFVPVTAEEHPVPCIIGLHGVFSPSEEQFWMMADFLAKRGIAGIAPSLPQHHRRAKGKQLVSGQRFVVGSPETIRDNLRQAVVDQRRAVDWLSTRPEIDPAAISIAGISLGGIVGSLTYKVEPRLRNGVFVVAGSGVDGIVENSDLSVIAIFRQAARVKLLDPQKFVDALQIVDPINVPDLYPRPVLMMNATEDVIIASTEALRLYNTFGQAEQVWTNGNHYFPAYVGEYLTASFLANQMPDSYGETPPGSVLVASPGYRFIESVRRPLAGTNRLWVDLRVQTEEGGQEMEHQVAAPMVNRMVPVVLATRDTYSQIQHEISDLPAFIYLMESDNASQLAAALAYIDALDLSADPLVYYVAPSHGISCTLTQYSAADIESARHILSSVLSVESIGAISVGVPPAFLSDAIEYPNLAQAAITLSKKIRYEDLGPLPWFPAWEDQGVRWSLEPETLPLDPAN